MKLLQLIDARNAALAARDAAQVDALNQRIDARIAYIGGAR